MKNIQFKLSQEKYERAKEKLQKAGLSWQRLCEQISDYVIHSESLDKFGIPLFEMAPSIRQQAKSAIEGHIETALWKYVQIQNDPDGRDRGHWMAGLQAALKQVVKTNSWKNVKDGYVFDEKQLGAILDSMWIDSVWLAAKHLGTDPKRITVQKPRLKELFKFASIPFSLYER